MDTLGNELDLLNFKCETYEGTYVCTKSTSFELPPDKIEFHLEFELLGMNREHLKAKALRLRTSSFKISHDDIFFCHLRLVIEAQLLQGELWDNRCIEVYEMNDLHICE